MSPQEFLVHLRFFELAQLLVAFAYLLFARDVLRRNLWLALTLAFIVIQLVAIVVWVVWLKVPLL